MIRFTSLLFFRSMRWVAPALVAGLWTAVAMSAGEETTVSRSGAMFLCYVIVGAWTTILIGNVDDDAHRELLTAVAGTRIRLHLLRLGTALVWSGGFAVLVTTASLAMHRHAHGLAVESASAFGLAGSGVLIGVALGAPLHRPLLRSQATSLIAAVALLMFVVLLPPVQYILRRAGQDDVEPVPVVAAVALGLAAASAAASALASERRRT